MAQPDLLEEDRLARQRALDPGGSFIVQAPAGSGKTELLTQRFLNLLTVADHPEEVVAITFTNKAAGEMANRVLEALRRAQNDLPPQADPELLTWTIARRVRERDENAGWNLQHNPRRLRIQTIDSLCANLARQMPVMSGLGARHDIAQDFDVLYREAALATLSELESDSPVARSVARLLRHLDNDVPRVERLLSEMLARRDQWLRHLGEDLRDERVRARLEQALSDVVRDALQVLPPMIPAGAATALVETAALGAAQLEASGKSSPVLACRGLAGLPDAEPADIPLWLGLRSLLLTNKGEWRQKVDHFVGLGRKVVGDAHYDRAQSVLAALKANDDLRRGLNALEMLPDSTYTDQQWELIEALHAVLPMAVAHLWLVFRRRGEIDYTQVQQAAVRALGEPERPTDLALALDYRIQHLLVDEFQDTSLSQFKLLRRLTAGWSPQDNHTLFAVGDPMQSVYRFRQAEVGLFLQARRTGLGDVPLEPLGLAINFRSQSGIIDWVNETFGQVFPARDESASGAVKYSPCVARPGAESGPGVVVHALPQASLEQEAQLVVRLVEDAQQETGKDATIAVLVRARSHLAQVVPALRRAGVRFRAVDIEALSDRQSVQDVHALARALAHPADRIAWLAVLRAPWCGLSLTDLHFVANAGTDTIWQAIETCDALPGPGPDGRARLARMRDVMSGVIEQHGRCGLRRRTEAAWLALGGPACVSSPTDIEDAMVYLDLLEKHEQADDIEHPGRLEEQVGKLFALPDADSSVRVQIMTIHKAKGLEFDTVIIPGLDRPPQSEGRRLLAWIERPRRSGVSDLLLAPIPAAGGAEDRTYGYVKSLDDARARNEDARLLYVAATRAIRRLHLVGRVRRDRKTGVASAPDRRSLLAALWPAVQGQFDAACAGHAAEDGTSGAAPDYASVQGIGRVPTGYSPVPPPGAVAWRGGLPELPEGGPSVEFSWAGRTAMHVGTVVHEFLLRIASAGLASWTAARVAAAEPGVRTRLRREGVEVEELDAAVASVLLALSAALSSPRGRWVLGEHGGARSEFPLAGLLDGEVVHLTLDRTFIDEKGMRWIVDYKTGTHEGSDLETFLNREQERYREQLERYARLVSVLDARPIRLGLYYPLLDGWREWVWEEIG